MDPMDVDSSPPPSFENIKDVLSQGQLTTLNDNMAEASQFWETTILVDGDDSQLRLLITNTFKDLVHALAETAMKSNVVTKQTVREMVKSSSKDELERWKVVVLNCVEKKDWVDLIRTCVSDYQTAGLRSIVTTAALTIQTRPNAASTPLHLSGLLNRGVHSK
jgi:isochorismate synthase EntC